MISSLRPTSLKLSLRTSLGGRSPQGRGERAGKFFLLICCVLALGAIFMLLYFPSVVSFLKGGQVYPAAAGSDALCGAPGAPCSQSLWY